MAGEGDSDTLELVIEHVFRIKDRGTVVACRRRSGDLRDATAGLRICGFRLALAMVAGASLLAGCTGEPSRSTVDQAIASLGWEGVHVLMDGPIGPERAVVVEGQRGVMPAVALLVVDPRDDRVDLTGTEDISAVEPATMDAVGFNDVLYVYGRIRDPAIREVALDLARGEIETFPIEPPAYVVRVEGVTVGAPQWWAFRDAGGATVYAPAGPSPTE